MSLEQEKISETGEKTEIENQDEENAEEEVLGTKNFDELLISQQTKNAIS